MAWPSAGLALASSPDEAGIAAEELLKRADLAMYSAKRTRGRGVHIFNSEMAPGDSREVDAAGVDVSGGESLSGPKPSS